MTDQTVNDEIDNADAALAEYMRRTDAGQQVDRQSFVAEFPQFADELREYFAAAEEIDRMAGPPMVSTVKNAGQSVETHVTSVGDSVSERPRKQPQTSSADSLPEVFGRYRIEKQLGRGAMGAVYLAHDTQLDRPVALKTPTFNTTTDAEMVERFYREARAAANLRHAGICPVFDVGEIDGTHYISMAYIEGKPLSGIVNIDKPLPTRTAVSLMRKIALALDHAHGHGVIHRDLKPANIMIDRERQPLIMDFGLARQIDKQDQTRLTQNGMILGTPAYMSPEQIQGDLGAGKQSDIYSLGVILFELLTGDIPFQGTIAAIIGQVVTQDAPPPSEFRKEVDAELDAICQKMMARKIGDRYASMKELAQALTNYLRRGKQATKGNANDRNPAASRSRVSQSAPKQTISADEGLAAFLSTTSRDDIPVVKPQHNETMTQLLRPWQKLPSLTKVIATSALAALLLLMSVVLFIQTEDGATVRIEILDPDLKVVLAGDSFTIQDKDKFTSVEIGWHTLRITGASGLTAETEKFEIRNGDKVRLKVELIKGKVVVMRDDNQELKTESIDQKSKSNPNTPGSGSGEVPRFSNPELQQIA